MANTVLFKKGLSTALPAAASREANTLYYVTDTGEFYLGATRFSDVVLDNAAPALADVLNNQIHIFGNKLYFRGTKEVDSETVDTVIVVDAGKLAQDIQELKDLVGTLPQDAQSENVVDYIAEYAVEKVAAKENDASISVDNTDEKHPKLSVNLHEAVEDEAENAIEKKDDGLYVPTPAAADTYKIVAADTADTGYLTTLVLNKYPNGDETKNPTACGKINIPKDFLLKSGTVEEVTEANKGTEGRPDTAGTYIKLVLNTADSENGTADNKTLWINAGSLIEYVTSGSNAGDMVVITIDSDTHEVTAEITDNTITNAKLKDGTIENGKIKDATIEKGKLAAAVQSSLDAADTAVQGADIKATTGTADEDKGTFTVTVRTIDETDNTVKTADKKVKINGLGSAAYLDKVDTIAEEGSTEGKIPTDTAVRTEFDKKVDLVSGEGINNTVAALTANGGLKSSGYTLGGNKLAEEPSDKTLATEKAVSEAVAEAVSSGLSWGTF